MSIPLEKHLFTVYASSVALLALKMLSMSFSTAFFRFKTGTFANPEDNKGKKSQPNESVERVRRAHLNDLENIPIFLFVAFVYLTTNPSLWSAQVYLYSFVAARFIHTLTYLFAIQPFRAISFFVGVLATIGMSVQILKTYCPC
eukprot:TRINITY_DN1128_c0_g2_i1.p1 TRINITY_DN1128_c0_g2~~TRINITY_DN1128_c0_g2_i1.p1  ORF type:complete len:144 (-),score=50.05 TRINITY_DN1128_c0_g2_i1:93-524(-)